MKPGTKKEVGGGIRWGVYVERSRLSLVHRAIFRVENQFFTLAESDDPDEGAYEVEFTARMFLRALSLLVVFTGMSPADAVPSPAKLEKAYESWRKKINRDFTAKQKRKAARR